MTPEPFGDYLLLERIGVGGMAEVFRAEARAGRLAGTTVALKRLLPRYAHDEEARGLLLDEARIVASLVHPNIQRLLDFGQVGQTLYLAMEFVPGHNLAATLKACRARGLVVPIGVAVFVGREISRGLHAAHVATDREGRGLHIVHRDVSPHNVLLGFAGEVKVIDFGVALARTKLVETATGYVRGKPMYMAPEQATGEGVDPRSDLFSLGLVLYEVLTGRHPLLDPADPSLVSRLVPPSEIRPDIPPALERVVLWAMEQAPEMRPRDGAELERALDALDQPDSTAEALARFMAQVFPDEAGTGPEFQTSDHAFDRTIQDASSWIHEAPGPAGPVDDAPTVQDPVGAMSMERTEILPEPDGSTLPWAGRRPRPAVPPPPRPRAARGSERAPWWLWVIIGVALVGVVVMAGTILALIL